MNIVNTLWLLSNFLLKAFCRESKQFFDSGTAYALHKLIRIELQLLHFLADQHDAPLVTSQLYSCISKIYIPTLLHHEEYGQLIDRFWTQRHCCTVAGSCTVQPGHCIGELDFRKLAQSYGRKRCMAYSKVLGSVVIYLETLNLQGYLLGLRISILQIRLA